MSQKLKLDLRGKSCEEFILEISKVIVSMKPGDMLTILANQDRIICTHQLLRNSPRYLFKGDIVNGEAIITIKRLR